MAETIRPRVEVEDDGIIVSLPGTSFRVIYRKPYRGSNLVAFDVRGDKTAGISQVDFLARAGRVTRLENSAGWCVSIVSGKSWVTWKSSGKGGLWLTITNREWRKPPSGWWR
jgi:hypothetical protein